MFLRLGVLLMVAVLLGGCSLIPGSGGNALTYDGAVEHTIRVGEQLSGTYIQYLNWTEQGAQVAINDEFVIKKVGDSLDWKGPIAPGADASLSQRIVAADENRIQTVGAVRVTVRNPNPQPGPFSGGGPYIFKVGAGHTVRKGDTIPGTTLTFLGRTDEGAQFGGIDGYPFRKLGDSVVWTGQVAPRVFVEMTYRVGAYTDDVLTVAGLGTVGAQ